MALIIQNFILFQIGWLCCVLGGASQHFSWVGVVAVIIIVSLHLALAINRKSELMLIVIAMILGTAWDSGLMMTNLFIFPNGTALPGIVPLWLIAMWALFTTTLNVSLKWMKQKYLLAALFGAIGGPVAYYAGHRLGAVEFGGTLLTLSVVAIGWAVIMPTLMLLSEKFNGYMKPVNKSIEAVQYE